LEPRVTSRASEATVVEPLDERLGEASGVIAGETAEDEPALFGWREPPRRSCLPDAPCSLRCSAAKRTAIDVE